MHGLTVRWSLAGTEPELLDRLRRYVREESYAGFAGSSGLRYKTWRARAGAWFEGHYVFASSADREAFEASFRERAATAPGSVMIGAAPEFIEPCEIIAVAEGADGFLAAPDYSAL